MIDKEWIEVYSWEHRNIVIPRTDVCTYYGPVLSEKQHLLAMLHPRKDQKRSIQYEQIATRLVHFENLPGRQTGM